MNEELRSQVAAVIGNRPIAARHVAILTAAGFDPERTVTEYEGDDWGLESEGDLVAASVYRHVPLKYLVADDVNLMLLWGSSAAPLVELALHHLERNPFTATNGHTYSAMLMNVAEALSPPSGDGGSLPIPEDHPYRDRFAAVCRMARAMIDDGRVQEAAADLYEDPEAMLRSAEARLGAASA